MGPDLHGQSVGDGPGTAGGSRGPVHAMRMINRRVATLAGAAVLFMIPWMVHLGLTLPGRYDAQHWRLLWVGFDTFEVVVLVHVAWSAWFRRQVTLVSAIVAGTLLFSDAWFDVVTSFGSRDEWVTLSTALAGELPLALFFFWIARRILVIPEGATLVKRVLLEEEHDFSPSGGIST